MAWNEPGGGNSKDPWGGRGDQGPPDLDEIFRKMSDRLGGFMGKRKGGGGGGGGSRAGGVGIGVIVLIAVLVWLASGIYIVDEGKRGVILRFGEYVETTMPGPHWHIPYPVESVDVVDVSQRRFVEIGYRSAGSRGNNTVSVPQEALMLTQDENIVNLQLAVQYQVSDARQYLFNVRDPDITLKQIAESSVREVIGKSKMDFVLTEGRAEVVNRTRELMQSILDQYGAGMVVHTVNMQDAQPPEEVQDAFADAIKAREDEVRQKNEAEAYANDILPKARGAAARQLEEAQGYKEAVIAQAEGETSRFLQLLKEYEQAPEVTRKRLYLETMEAVLGRSSKITVDVQGGNSLLYLPIDRMMQGRGVPLPDVDRSVFGRESSARQSSSSPASSNDTGREPRRIREPR